MVEADEGDIDSEEDSRQELEEDDLKESNEERKS